MDDKTEELAGEEIARFIELQAKEGKTAEETIEALTAAVGGETPKFKEKEPLVAGQADTAPTRAEDLESVAAKENDKEEKFQFSWPLIVIGMLSVIVPFVIAKFFS